MMGRQVALREPEFQPRLNIFGVNEVMAHAVQPAAIVALKLREAYDHERGLSYIDGSDMDRREVFATLEDACRRGLAEVHHDRFNYQFIVHLTDMGREFLRKNDPEIMGRRSKRLIDVA